MEPSFKRTTCSFQANSTYALVESIIQTATQTVLLSEVVTQQNVSVCSSSLGIDSSKAPSMVGASALMGVAQSSEITTASGIAASNSTQKLIYLYGKILLKKKGRKKLRP